MGYEADTRHRDGDREDLEHLKGYGLTAEEARNMVEIASTCNFTSRMSLASGMIPNEEYCVLVR